MVDFSKRLRKGKTEKKISPFEIYDSLDRSSDHWTFETSQDLSP